MMRSSVLQTIPVIAALVFAGSALAQGFHPGNAVRINGVEISNQRFNAFYAELQRSKGVNAGARGDQLNLMKQLRKEAMDLMIERELIVQAAKASGIEVNDSAVDAELASIKEPFNTEAEFMRRLETESYTEESYREHLRDMIAAKHYVDGIRLKAMSVSDEELERFYNENSDRLTLPEQVRVRHVLLSWQPMGTGDDRKALYDKMQALLDRARAGEDFAQLATDHSNDSTRVDGGDVGMFRRGQMMPAFEHAAFALQPGEISDIVETPYGLHIIKLEERQEARLLPLEEIREQLRDHLSEEQMEAAVEAEKQRLREQAEIDILITLPDTEKRRARQL
jgi:peptidyl-prolyl cis-trans isomerase C